MEQTMGRVERGTRLVFAVLSAGFGSFVIGACLLVSDSSDPLIWWSLVGFGVFHLCLGVGMGITAVRGSTPLKDALAEHSSEAGVSGES